MKLISFNEFIELLTESTPPGMEGWVKEHKREDLPKSELYATAWKLFWEAADKHLGRTTLKQFVDFTGESPNIIDRRGLEIAIKGIDNSSIINR